MSQGNSQPQQQPGQARMPQQQGPFGFAPTPSSQSLNQPGPQLLQAQPQNSPQAVGQSTSARRSLRTDLLSEAEKLWFVRRHLALLFHASQCRMGEQEQQNGTGGQQRCCNISHCPTIKNVLNHMTGCTDMQCNLPFCAISRTMLAHWENCDRPNCKLCSPFRQTPEQKQAQIFSLIQSNKQFTDAVDRNIELQKTYEAHVALGIPFNNHNYNSPLLRQTNGGIPSSSQSLNQPGPQLLQAHNYSQAAGQFTPTPQSNYPGYAQPPQPQSQPHQTQFSQNVDFQKTYQAFGAPNNHCCNSRASGQIPGLSQIPGQLLEPIQVKDWHNSVPKELRNNLVQKIIQVIIPNPDPSIFRDSRMVTLVGCARKVEGDIYQKADSRAEYYVMLAAKMAKIKKLYHG